MPRYLTPTGIVNRPLWKLAQLVAGCTTFQSLVGAADAEEAVERIHFREASDIQDPDTGEIEDARPRAIVNEFRRWNSRRTGRNSLERDGELLLTIELPMFTRFEFWSESYWPEGYWPEGYWPATAMSLQDRLMAAANTVGALLAEMETRSAGQPAAGDLDDPENETLLNVTDIQQFTPLVEMNVAEEGGEYYAAVEYAVSWR